MMGFIERFSFLDTSPPGRAYLHEAGFENIFEGSREEAKKYLLSVIDSYRLDYDYFLASVWGDAEKGEKVVDFFGYKNMHPWPGNPDISAYVFRNGLYVSENSITCGDTLIVLGEEEKRRRQTRSLEEYLSRPPDVELRLLLQSLMPDV